MTKQVKPLLLVALGLALAIPLAAQDEDAPEPPPRAPASDRDGVEIPPKVEGEQLEPEVRIHEDEEGSVVEEYLQDGRVFMVKVTPKVGPPYYYFDDDGDGRLELRESDAAAWPVKPVYWKVREWD